MATYKPNAGASENLMRLLREQGTRFDGSEPFEVLVAKTIFNISNASSDGDVGSDLLKTATVTLTDAQIKALPTTSIEVVAAPGENRLLVFMAATLNVNVEADIYSNVSDGCAMFIGLSGVPSGGVSNVMDVEDRGLLTSYDRKVGVLRPISESLSLDDFVVSAGGSANKGFSVKMTNTDGNLTGGNAANTLKVTVWYVEVDV